MVLPNRSLQMRLVTEDVSFVLGRTVDVVVEVEARRDVEVQEARVDLICEQEWTEIYTVMVPPPDAFGHRDTPVHTQQGFTPRVPQQVTEERKETYVFGGSVFLTDERLYGGEGNRYSVKLALDAERPPQIENATLRWTLTAKIDVPRSPDVTVEQDATVTWDNSLAPKQARPGKRTSSSGGSIGNAKSSVQWYKRIGTRGWGAIAIIAIVLLSAFYPDFMIVMSVIGAIAGGIWYYVFRVVLK